MGSNVITISRQLGSLGMDIAREAAACLGYRLVWRDLINQAARRAGSPEMALAAIDDLGLFGPCSTPQSCQAYRIALGEIMHELADEGRVVIVGRAGQAILRGRSNVVHVRIYAPADLRARRVASKQKIGLEHAQAQIEASDKSRKRFLKRFYQVRWDDPDLYDLSLNTARVSPAAGAGLICKALETPLEDIEDISPEQESV